MIDVSRLTGKRVLVTGGAGFIGSHLVEALVSANAHVTVLDDLSTGSLQNLSAVKDKITCIQGSITDLETCNRACKYQVIVFHLAAQVSVTDSMHNPSACFQTNVIGTQHMLQACVNNGVERFVFSSSSAVYGTHNGMCSEETPCKPESVYGHSKLVGELLCKNYAKEYPITCVSLRYFNVYGDRQNPQGSYAAVVPKFKLCMQTNTAITIFGDGLQRRDFVPVASVVQANIGSGLVETTTTETFNVATGTSITLLELVDRLHADYPQFSAGIRFQPARTGDIYSSQADCRKLKQLLEHSEG